MSAQLQPSVRIDELDDKTTYLSGRKYQKKGAPDSTLKG